MSGFCPNSYDILSDFEVSKTSTHFFLASKKFVALILIQKNQKYLIDSTSVRHDNILIKKPLNAGKLKFLTIKISVL